MQPNGVDVAASEVLAPSQVVLAREAFLRGDFDACFEALDRVMALPSAELREASLLRARALIRTRRFDDAASFLGPILGTFVTVDEACTAKMLHGAAVSRLDGKHGIDRGLRLLEGVAAAADELGAHLAIRGEIAYMLAFVHWMKRDFHAVLHYAVIAERTQADVISVRAASLRGYVALAKERYPEALALFRFALRAYRACKERDADLALRIVVQIAALEVALRSATVAGTHDLPDGAGRITKADDAANIPGVFHMEIAALDAWLYAFDSNRKKAYRNVRIAERLAPNDAWRVWALANRAKISAAFGDDDWADEYAIEALEISEQINWNATDDEERVALLHLAEALAVCGSDAAAKVLSRYDQLTTTVDRALLMHDDVRLWILETFVRGLVHRARRRPAEAYRAFQAVREQARRVGIRWRETLALIELDATRYEGVDPHDRPLASAAAMIRDNFPASFLARRLGRWSRAFTEPVAATLAPQPREVLRHLLAAAATKEIAKRMRLSEHTVKQYVLTLYRKFGVNSREELLVTCYTRGIGSPHGGPRSTRKSSGRMPGHEFRRRQCGPFEIFGNRPHRLIRILVRAGSEGPAVSAASTDPAIGAGRAPRGSTSADALERLLQ